MRELEELQTSVEKLRREAKFGIAGSQEEMAGLQEQLTRKARITEKEIERAKVSSSCGPSFQSISPDDSLRMDGRNRKT